MSKNMNARGEGIFNDAAFAVGVIPPYCVDRTRRSASKSSRGIGNPCETRLNLHRTRPKESDGRGFCAMCTGRVVRVGYDTVTLRINDRSHVRACDWAGRERYMKIGLGWLLHITSDDSITVVIYIYAFLLCACGMELSFTSQRMQRITSRSRGHVKRMLLPKPARKSEPLRIPTPSCRRSDPLCGAAWSRAP